MFSSQSNGTSDCFLRILVVLFLILNLIISVSRLIWVVVAPWDSSSFHLYCSSFGS